MSHTYTHTHTHTHTLSLVFFIFLVFKRQSLGCSLVSLDMLCYGLINLMFLLRCVKRK